MPRAKCAACWAASTRRWPSGWTRLTRKRARRRNAILAERFHHRLTALDQALDLLDRVPLVDVHAGGDAGGSVEPQRPQRQLAAPLPAHEPIGRAVQTDVLHPELVL